MIVDHLLQETLHLLRRCRGVGRADDVGGRLEGEREHVCYGSVYISYCESECNDTYLRDAEQRDCN